MDPERKADLMRLGVQATLMRELIQTPYWECYREFLHEMMEDAVSRMIIGTKDDFEYRKGIISGFKQALNLPEQIVQRAEMATRN